MAKKYLIVEEESSGAAGCLAIAAVIAVIYFVLSYAHLLMAGGLGFCGFLIGRHIIDSNPIYKWQHKTAIFLTSIVLMGGLGYLGGQQISDHFKKSIESSPTEETKPETQKSPAAVNELPEPQKAPVVTEKKPTELSGDSREQKSPENSSESNNSNGLSYPPENLPMESPTSPEQNKP